MGDSPKQFIKRFFGFSIGPVISAFLSLFTVPLTTHFIAPDEFGRAAMYTMALSISSLFIYLGMDQSFVREYNLEKDKKNLFWNSLIVPLLFSFIVGIIYLLFYKGISIWMFDREEKYIMQVLAISVPFTVIDRFNMLVIRMEEKAKLYSILNIISKLANVVILVPYLLYIDKSFRGVVNAGFISLVVLCIAEFCFTKKYWITKFKIDNILLEKLFKFGLPLVPASVISWILNSMDRIAMKQWSTLTEIGLYSSALKIVMIIGIVRDAFCTFWAPTAFRWHEEGVSNERYIKVSEMLMCFMAILFVGIVLFKDLVIKIFGTKYVGASVIVPFLLFLPIMYTVSETTTLGISFSRKTSYNILVSIVAAVTNYIGNYLLVPTLGGLGASISTGISYTVFFWMRTFISRKLWFKFPLKFYFLNTVFMLLFATFNVFYNKIYLNIIFSAIILFINRRQINEILQIAKGLLCKKEIKFNN
ncbi:polysaccharide biosynthesis protein [Clostridium acetireducens DSM 10703]|uniref:Polysaccharide biosynthesis protein n=1 Tax=Clostridium acetireducens DSM 10703 TaxID=1121290 RepID=A0A1E8EXA0_9CLOT|nr:oligosaccharide flippase family protein [Clostridium acetireducens]OFI04998.1 polysaccharide biosynthesis protein [Clostridium acetireducens DSM 10703]